MKKILASLLVISSIAAVGYLGTQAIFSDTETSTGNKFTTGTIDIAVDRENPWISTEEFVLEDMKPSYVDYIEFVVYNVGTNPANIYKTLNITDRIDVPISEPECDYGGGAWDSNVAKCDVSHYSGRWDIDSRINYDMLVEVYNVDPEQNSTAEPIWWQIIYTDEMDERLSVRDGNQVYLGMLPEGWWMRVEQSYHMVSGVENWAQSDSLVFDISLYAEQLSGVVEMENKTDSNGPNPTLVYDDGIKGTFTYENVKDATFDWSFTGRVPQANTEYAVLFYYEGWSSPAATGWPRTVYVLGKRMSDNNGDITFMDESEDFGYDITNMKVWLAPTSTLVSPDLLGLNTMNGWSGDDYLFELGLMDYYDSL